MLRPLLRCAWPLVAAALLVACATPPGQAPVGDGGLFADEAFAPPREPVSAERVFALSPAP